MKTLNPSDIVHLLREEYVNHLHSKINEIRAFNSKGQMVISKDLKVKHKPSGFVYTVKGVTGEPGQAKIVLRSPEEPRVEPDGEMKPAVIGADAIKKPIDLPKSSKPLGDEPLKGEVMEDTGDDKKEKKKSEKKDKKDYGIKAYPKEKEAPKHDQGDTMFVIDQKEFEKHYEEA